MMDISVVVIIKVQSTFWIYPPPHTHTHFFESVLRPFQYYFSSYENGQSEGGAITGEPLETHLAHPQAELGLSHMWPERSSNPHQGGPRGRAVKSAVS